MKRLKMLIVIFCIAISAPLAYFVLKTWRSLEFDERAELRYFAETLFDRMEQELADLIRQEEARAVDEYNYHYNDSISGSKISPLSQIPKQPYILGYFQNNPDGSFQTPMAENPDQGFGDDRQAVISQLKELNALFNPKRTTSAEAYEIQPMEAAQQATQESASSFGAKYLDFSMGAKQKSRLGQEDKRVEQITVGQAMNLAQTDETHRRKLASADRSVPKTPAPAVLASDVSDSLLAKDQSKSEKELSKEPDAATRASDSPKPMNEVQAGTSPLSEKILQVEVDPMQSVFIDDHRIFIFRRIVLHQQIFRQGFVLLANEFLNRLAEAHFVTQPMAQFTGLTLKITDHKRPTAIVHSGAAVTHPKFMLEHSFPRPFSFLKASLACERIPESQGRKTLNIMITVLTAVVLIGLFAIYQSAAAVMELSERRSQFVSSVTHELKTPLTNIRMYIEMLEQGIARTPEREQEYFRILSSESARLSRLISNILEFSKLEKKQFPVHLQEGDFTDVIESVQEIMREKLRQEGFVLKIEVGSIPVFRYDREGMIQVFINLIENSMKFGKSCPKKEILLWVQKVGSRIQISVSDTGPGIPVYALKKVFDDFYRVDNAVTKAARGTGIGLAFVKKFVQTVGGTVSASNNATNGCTITISLPCG